MAIRLVLYKYNGGIAITEGQGYFAEKYAIIVKECTCAGPCTELSALIQQESKGKAFTTNMCLYPARLYPTLTCYVVGNFIDQIEDS